MLMIRYRYSITINSFQIQSFLTIIDLTKKHKKWFIVTIYFKCLSHKVTLKVNQLFQTLLYFSMIWCMMAWEDVITKSTVMC